MHKIPYWQLSIKQHDIQPLIQNVLSESNLSEQSAPIIGTASDNEIINFNEELPYDYHCVIIPMVISTTQATHIRAEACDKTKNGFRLLCRSVTNYGLPNETKVFGGKAMFIVYPKQENKFTVSKGYIIKFSNLPNIVYTVKTTSSTNEVKEYTISSQPVEILGEYSGKWEITNAYFNDINKGIAHFKITDGIFTKKDEYNPEIDNYNIGSLRTYRGANISIEKIIKPETCKPHFVVEDIILENIHYKGNAIISTHNIVDKPSIKIRDIDISKDKYQYAYITLSKSNFDYANRASVENVYAELSINKSVSIKQQKLTYNISSYPQIKDINLSANKIVGGYIQLYINTEVK